MKYALETEHHLPAVIAVVIIFALLTLLVATEPAPGESESSPRCPRADAERSEG